MKRILLICLTALSSATLLAADFTEDGFYYNVTSEEGSSTPTVEVTYTGSSKTTTTTYEGEITIPDKVTHEGTEYTVTGIGEYSFYCSSKSTKVTAVSLPTTITSIGQYAFRYCQGLTSLNLPSGLTTIGGYAFAYCTGLTSLEIPSSVTSIGTYAFSSCSGLTEMKLPQAITELPEGIFQSCSGLTTFDLTGFTTIGSNAFSNCSALTDITIPSTVTSIGTYAFRACSSLTEIEIPEAITSLSNYIFYQCSGLKNVKLPSGLTSIGTYEFYQCTSLEEITIPDGVTEIGADTFYGCTSLKKVNIPEGVTTIGAYLFQNCSALESLTLPEGTLTIAGSAFRASGLKEISIPDKVSSINTYILYQCTSLEKASIGSGVPALGTYTFNGCTALAEITSFNPTPPTCTNTNVFTNVPTTCVLKVPTQSIEAYKADTYWKVFTNVEGIGYLPEVTTLDASDVAHTTAVFNASVSTYDEADAIIEQGFEYWADPTNVKKVVVANGGEMSVTATDLEKSTQYTYCAYAKTENHIMYGEQLTFTTLPGDFTYNGLNYEFGEEDGTCEVACCFIDPTQSSATKKYNPEGTRYAGEIAIPDKVTYNGKTYTVVGVGEYAFYECTELTSVTFPTSLDYISDYAFTYAGLTSVDIPDNVTTLGRWAFQYNYSMTSAKIGDGITEIGSSAFYGANTAGTSVLEEVIIGDNVEVIGAQAFQYCDIHEIILPTKVVQLGNNAFYGNGNLIKVTSLNPEPPECLTANVFKNIAEECQLYVPKGSADAYSAAEVWQDFYDILVVGEPTLATVGSSNLTKGTATLTGTIAENAYDIFERGFEYWTNENDIKTIVATDVDGNNVSATATGLTPNSTYTYRVYAKYAVSDSETGTTYGKEKTYSTNQNADFYVDGFFYIYDDDGTCLLTYKDEEYNTYSAAITVPDETTYLDTEYTVVGIGASAFRECADLTKVTIPEASTSIGIFAFYNCTSLTEVTIPDAVTSIGNQAFNGCSALTKATIGSSVESLGQSAFANCSALAELYTLNPEPPTCGTQAFNNVDHETCTLYVPDRTYDVYSTANTWQDFYIVEMTEFAVETYEATDVTDVSAVLNGYIAEDYSAQGSITSKGFVYWQDDKDNGTTITVDDSNKTIAYTVEGLSSETTYTYCAFAVTSDGTTYGEEKTFTTAVPDGINGIHISLDTENVEGIYSTSGQKLNTTMKGVNIIRYNDGSVKKIYVK